MLENILRKEKGKVFKSYRKILLTVSVVAKLERKWNNNEERENLKNDICSQISINLELEILGEIEKVQT